MTLRVISKTASSTLFLRKLATLPSKAKGSSTIAKCLSASRSLQVSYYSNSTTDNYFGATTPTLLSSEESTSGWSHADPDDTRLIKYDIPQRVRQKLISAEDAVALVRDGDTVCVSGFVTQGAPELVLKTLGERFAKTKSPKNLTLFFGGGPGDYGEKGLSHLAKVAEDGTCMLKRTIGGHYGQVPKVAELALSEKVEAWTLPMGSVSRMIRSQSTHSPGHITTIGLGTYVDPKLNGEYYYLDEFDRQLAAVTSVAYSHNLTIFNLARWGCQ